MARRRRRWMEREKELRAESKDDEKETYEEKDLSLQVSSMHSYQIVSGEFGAMTAPTAVAVVV